MPYISGGTSGGGTTPTDTWVASGDVWTFASAATFTIASVDRTAIFVPGTLLKFTQTTVKYATVVSSSFGASTTTVTIAVNTDYVLANAAITSPFYSYAANPQGFPALFNFTPGAITGWAATPTVNQAQYKVVGRVVSVWCDISGTSNAATATFTTPFTAAGSASFMGYCVALDNGVVQTIPGRCQVAGGAATISCGKTYSATGGFTASGAKEVLTTNVFPF